MPPKAIAPTLANIKENNNRSMKKLQIFVSSTYTDLLDERQAAVEAILDAGHIPAGMELFKPEDKSQLETIKRWIKNSDAFMLILGGRYGSIEEKSNKSYTEIEYRFALKHKIPAFALVINEKGLKNKIKILKRKNSIESINPDKYREFKKFVESKTCRYFDGCEVIKSHFFAKIRDIEQEKDLIGWIRANEINITGNNPIINESSIELRKIMNDGWPLKDYNVNKTITDNLCLSLFINISEIEQKFVFYFYFHTDRNEKYWIGYTNRKNDNYVRPNENTQDVLLPNTHHFLIIENIKKTISERLPNLLGNPTIIEKVRIRGDADISQQINFHFGFFEKK
jgi:hypothetical protein